MHQYLNNDGTYTSPRNGKTYRSLKAFIAHWHYAGTTDPESFKKRLCNKECKFCKKEIISSNISKHEKTCYLNPIVTKMCIVCNSPIKNYKNSKGTCSRSCANIHFRSGENNGNWKIDQYSTTCFAYHEKKCIVCGEERIVAVHHYNEIHTDNSVDNLIPMCPTHHQYMHSKYKSEIIQTVEEYIKNFKNISR